MIKINVEKAKEIQKDRMRYMREPLLEKLDVDFVKALEFGGDTSAIAAQKQALRDVTNIVTGAEINSTTVNEIIAEIDAIWDEDLLGPKPG